MTYGELTDFYEMMGIGGFESYVLDLNAKNDQVKDIEVSQQIDAKNDIAFRSTQSEQFYYYSSTNRNYLALRTQVVTSGGVTYYNSVTGLGYNTTATGYPYYVPYKSSYSASGDSRQITCTYNCSKYIAAGLIDGGSYTLRVTFTAGGGNIYA